VKKAVVAAMLSGDIPPNQTIYIKNLNDKVKKEGDFSSILLLAFNFLLCSVDLSLEPRVFCVKST
jgi:hypothetical protein